jgi:hypothetical protein
VNEDPYPELAGLREAIATIHDHQDAIEDINSSLPELVLNLRKITDPARRKAAAEYAYWYIPEVHVKDIAFALTGRSATNALNGVISPETTKFSCADCSASIAIKSRQGLKDLIASLRRSLKSDRRSDPSKQLLCSSCAATKREEWAAKNEIVRREMTAHWSELRKLSYDKYLATPEFKASREISIELLLREHHNLTCEICPSTEGIGLFHKIDRALPIDSATILLCQSCRDTLVGARKIHQPCSHGHMIPPMVVTNIFNKLYPSY